MNLYASMSAAEADRAEHGALRGDFVWAEEPRPDEAAADTVWVSIDVPDKRLHRFERRDDARRGYREFLLPARITNLHRARRITLPL